MNTFSSVFNHNSSYTWWSKAFLISIISNDSHSKSCMPDSQQYSLNLYLSNNEEDNEIFLCGKVMNSENFPVCLCCTNPQIFSRETAIGIYQYLGEGSKGIVANRSCPFFYEGSSTSPSKHENSLCILFLGQYTR